MMLKPSDHPDHQIEVWEGQHQAATIYATRSGLHIIIEPEYSHQLAVEPQLPVGVVVSLKRDD